MDRRTFVAAALSTLAAALATLAAALATLAAAPAHAADFEDFVESLRASAEQAGVRGEIFDSVARGLTQDPSLSGKRAAQSEFIRPLRAYVDDAASPSRAAHGHELREKYAAPLRVVTAASGAPGEMLVALWGMESDFGRDHGDRDIFRTLATLAFLHPDNPVYAQEFVAGLVLLQRGFPREKLKGSWAGAMGDPQFMPSAYLKYARAFSGAGPADIWSSAPDTLASIGNFLKMSGWRPGQPSLVEVKIPANFAFATLKQDFSAWAQAGVAPLEGALPRRGEAMLFFPCGAEGPAFLLGENFFVLKAYNFSDSYAFAAAILADRIAGRAVLRVAWPKEAQPLTLAEREAIQRGLTAAGFYDGKIDGRFGPVTREAIHAFQRRAGIRQADGYPSRALLEALRKSE